MYVCGDTHTHISTQIKLPGSGMEKSDKLIGTKTARDRKFSKITVGCLPGHTVISSAELSGIRTKLLLLAKAAMLKKNKTPSEFPGK